MDEQLFSLLFLSTPGCKLNCVDWKSFQKEINAGAQYSNAPTEQIGFARFSDSEYRFLAGHKASQQRDRSTGSVETTQPDSPGFLTAGESGSGSTLLIKTASTFTTHQHPFRAAS